MSELGDEEESLSFILKDKEENKENEDEDEKERDKKEEEEILHRYEKIGNLKDIQAIKESELTKNYDDKGNKYYNEYQLIELLGKGAYSKVKLVVKDNVKYAMKIIDKKELKKKKIFKQDPDGNVIVTTLLRDALKEIAILKKLDHPNIIKLIEILHNYKKEKIYLILEYADYGDIVDYDEENNIFSINKNISNIYNEKKIEEKSFNTKQYYREKDITSFCKDIVLGLDYLHKNGIIHHDIKPNNILLCKKGICKITDFNFSSILENLNVDNIGQNVDCADHFKAPETLETLEDENNNDDEKNENDKKNKNESNYFRGKPLDIWALGITIYIITYLKFPFDSDKGIIDLYETIRKEKVKFPREPFYSKKIKYLIEKCLEKNPEKRKTAEEIIKMCAVHKYDVLDKYKPIFKKRNYDINISNEELCMTLDFFHNECNAVFENPDDKSKPIILKFKKQLIRFELPKDRSLTKITIKENIHYVPIKPPIEKKSEGSSKTITTHIITTRSDDPMKSFTVKKTIVLEVDNNNSNSVKVTKQITTNGNGDKEVEDLEMEKKIMDDLQKIGDGKAVIQKYISEK
jgi:[calcium/calmodulin-dependent protein kinase] kinase